VPERRRARRRRRSAQTATWPISNASVGIKRDPDLHRPQLHELGITHFTLAPTRRTTTWPTWTPGSNGTTGRTPGTRLHAAMTSVGRGHGRPAAVSYWPALTDSGRLRASLNRRVMAALICMFFTAMPSGWVTTVSTSNTPVRVYQYFEIPEMSVAIM
jgi:hypothetical protein